VPLLLSGVLLMLLAIVLELLDLRRARATIEIEIREMETREVAEVERLPETGGG
jgi:hypothetical protein